ncbi:heat shock protein Hsp20 [Ferrimonas balearica DSM 9799]|uniref:Heat shock protein Hsp20 n=1 Tax=Ferrimonas balearica (strain DSM 9799 / CCM 4581 / KCTC 23876 / PAT) TaxID=550540 RepID=E1SRT5_FERBD|nr:Hsp20 family protein [Ferrimonas balearica]ADN74904.1 heat shock protein Hsp20 [Ferrimonas balearica DSM 9799]MBY5981472.1 Hsp20 family protein [Ferrimonas balearica]
MRTIDLTPLYKSAIGFDRFAKVMDEAMRAEQGGFPPYNIELVEQDKYRITMAVAGFSQDELDIEVEGDTLRIEGTKAKGDAPRQFLHQGIAERNFKRRFRLADHVKVVGADLQNGLLHVELEREIPEALKPRKISIGDSAPKVIEAKAS